MLIFTLFPAFQPQPTQTRMQVNATSRYEKHHFRQGVEMRTAFGGNVYSRRWNTVQQSLDG
ncbi:hypothetical protein [Phocaeicola sartorii]|uniref:hypothetical protein n=1 Tax=Phocaeicola sartorii TaxID=671267 RepID=UPI00100843FB|nr:hypothetical protein [Phocaeicola sartorii]